MGKSLWFTSIRVVMSQSSMIERKRAREDDEATMSSNPSKKRSPDECCNSGADSGRVCEGPTIKRESEPGAIAMADGGLSLGRLHSCSQQSTHYARDSLSFVVRSLAGDILAGPMLISSDDLATMTVGVFVAQIHVPRQSCVPILALGECVLDENVFLQEYCQSSVSIIELTLSWEDGYDPKSCNDDNKVSEDEFRKVVKHRNWSNKSVQAMVFASADRKFVKSHWLQEYNQGARIRSYHSNGCIVLIATCRDFVGRASDGRSHYKYVYDVLKGRMVERHSF